MSEFDFAESATVLLTPPRSPIMGYNTGDRNQEEYQYEMERQLEGTSIHAIRPTRNQRPKSAKHGVRSSTSGVNNVQRQTCAPNPESRLKQEETLQGRANRPKSAKNRSRDQNTELNTNPLHSEQDLLLSRPKSAKHGRRAGTRQMVVTNGIDGFHGNGRDDDRTGNGNRMDETKDAETPRSLCRPKSAGLRQGHPDQHVFSNGLPDSTPQPQRMDTRRTRPKSAHKSEFRRPKFSAPAEEDFDSACELDIETLVLQDKDFCISLDNGDGEYENARSIPESSAVSVSSGDSDHSGNGGGGNRRLLTRNSYHRHGNQTNNAEMDLRGYLGHDVNSSQHYCNRANSPLCEVEFELDPDLDESDENESSNYSGSPVSNGISRIKRKLQHRRFMSSPDTDAGGFPRETLKREPYSEPDFGARYGAKSQMKYQNVAKDVGQRVLQKYRRRASTDIDEMKPPGLKTSEAAIREKLNSGSTTNRRVPDRRQSLPAQTPRKLRPLLARSRPMESMEINSDLGTGSRSLGQTLAIQESSPVVPRRDSFNQSDPLLQVGSKSGNSKRDLKPVRPLRIEVPGTEDIQSVTSDGLSTTPPDSAFLSLPTSPGHIPSVNSHRPFEPARHRFSSDSGVGSRKSSLVHPNDDEAAMAALAAGRDELIANTPPRRASDVQRGEGLMPLGDIGKKPLCQTRSAPNSTVIGQS